MMIHLEIIIKIIIIIIIEIIAIQTNCSLASLSPSALVLTEVTHTFLYIPSTYQIVTLIFTINPMG